jgi:hypothetical protein
MNRNNIYKASIMTKDEIDSLADIYSKVIEDSGVLVNYFSYSAESNNYAPSKEIYMHLIGENNVTIGKFDATTVLAAIIPSESLRSADLTPCKNDRVVYSGKPFYVREITFLDKNNNLLNNFDNSFLCECSLVQKTDLLRSAKLA